MSLKLLGTFFLCNIYRQIFCGPCVIFGNIIVDGLFHRLFACLLRFLVTFHVITLTQSTRTSLPFLIINPSVRRVAAGWGVFVQHALI